MLTTFLSAPVPLTKTIERQADGTILKSPYPNVYNVTSHEEDCPDIGALYTAITKHAALGHCLLKGNIKRPLVNESRAGSTTPADSTQWLCLDIDGLPDTYGDPAAKVTVDSILAAIGLGDVSYILQWSASQGLDSSTLRLHVFMMLTKAVPAQVIKQWLIQLNHTTPLLSNALGLTKTGHALTWALDVTACQNDKLLYIAAPAFKGMKSPLGRWQTRISLVTGKLPAATFPSSTNTTAVNRALSDARIAELRDLAGLQPRKFQYKVVKNQEVLAKPDGATITETRTERGFVYFNLNGGDSWAYYHPEDCADIIYNFKGEPNYLTKELLPDYWASLTSTASRTTSTGLTYLAFLDRKTGAYHRGTYDATTDHLDLNVAKNETQMRHFAEQYGVPLGSYIPEWDLTFDPQNGVRVDFDNRVLNTFQLTQYMRTPAKKVTKCPPTIFRIIHHALGSDADCTVHFINWLAFILQQRARTLTAWVLHGTEGTGKGILMNRILRPIFGQNQTASRRMEELNEPYNAFMRQCFLVFVDEVEAKALLNEKGVMAKLRNFITEGTVTIRQMYSSAVEWENFCNWIFASNKPEPVLIPKDDRRFNVGKYQPNKLGMTDAELAKIPDELQAFHDFLLSYPVDKVAVATPLDNVDRNTMIAISESSIDTVANALLTGDMEFLLDQLPTNTAYSNNNLMREKVLDYKHAIQTLMVRTDQATGRCNISRDELRVIFEYVVGKIPESPNKFTSLLKHHRLYTIKVRCDDKPVYGIKTVFKDVAKFSSYVATHFPPEPKPKASPAKPPTKKVKS
jgi:hypothetical protein